MRKCIFAFSSDGPTLCVYVWPYSKTRSRKMLQLTIQMKRWRTPKSYHPSLFPSRPASLPFKGLTHSGAGPSPGRIQSPQSPLTQGRYKQDKAMLRNAFQWSQSTRWSVSCEGISVKRDCLRYEYADNFKTGILLEQGLSCLRLQTLSPRLLKILQTNWNLIFWHYNPPHWASTSF